MPIAVIVVAVVALFIYIRRKLRSGAGCCGEHEPTAKKIRPKDTDLSDHPYRYKAIIEGMVCTRRVRRAENAFNSYDGIYAVVTLDTKTAFVYSKTILSRRQAAQILSQADLVLTDFMEVE